jgi:hypothetical protein
VAVEVFAHSIHSAELEMLPVLKESLVQKRGRRICHCQLEVADSLQKEYLRQ